MSRTYERNGSHLCRRYGICSPKSVSEVHVFWIVSGFNMFLRGLTVVSGLLYALVCCSVVLFSNSNTGASFTPCVFFPLDCFPARPAMEGHYYCRFTAKPNQTLPELKDVVFELHISTYNVSTSLQTGPHDPAISLKTIVSVVSYGHSGHSGFLHHQN
jgi:hypothetical protein